MLALLARVELGLFARVARACGRLSLRVRSALCLCRLTRLQLGPLGGMARFDVDALLLMTCRQLGGGAIRRRPRDGGRRRW